MLKVIDISEANGSIDWKAVQASGVQGVILRAGYRGYGWSGTLVHDKMFHEHASKCRALAIPFGVYWLSQATNVAEALAEAEFLHAHIKHYELRLPVFLDSEWGEANGGTGRADRIGKKLRTECHLALLRKLREHGYDTGLYTGVYWFKDEIDGEAIRRDGHHIWLASVELVEPTIPYDAWQYSWVGKVPGVQTNVDMNYFAEKLYRRMGKHYIDTEGHWAEAAIDAVTDAGLMTGRGDGIFDPDDTVTRAELATVLTRVMGKQ